MERSISLPSAALKNEKEMSHIHILQDGTRTGVDLPTVGGHFHKVKGAKTSVTKGSDDDGHRHTYLGKKTGGPIGRQKKK